MKEYCGKVILLNGSPHKSGTTFAALSELAASLEECGIEAKIIHACADAHRGCIACGYCKKAGKCVFDDGVNEIAEELGINPIFVEDEVAVLEEYGFMDKEIIIF